MSSSFPRAARIKKNEAFKALLSKGKLFRRNGVALYYLPQTDLQTSRLGVMASKRVLKRAADRNLAKRIVREFFRKNQRHTKDRYDILIRFIGARRRVESKELRETLAALFERAGLT